MRRLFPLFSAIFMIMIQTLSLMADEKNTNCQFESFKLETVLSVGGITILEAFDSMESDWYAMSLPTAGFLAMEVSTDPENEVAPWLEIVGHNRPSENEIPVKDHATHWFGVVQKPGLLHMRIGSVGDEMAPELRFASRFVPFCESFDGVSGLDKIHPNDDSEETEEADNEIVPLRFDDVSCISSGWASKSSLQTQIDFKIDEGPSNEGGETEESDNEIMPRRGEDGLLMRRFCGSSDDLSLCASALTLGEITLGELRGGPDRDLDYFSFDLKRAERIRIVAVGGSEIFGTLYDQYGKRLLDSSVRSEVQSFVMDASLASGRYFLRIGSRWGESVMYELFVEPYPGALACSGP